MAHWRIPTGPREFQRPADFSGGAPENSNGASENSGSSQSFPTARRKFQPAPENFNGLPTLPAVHRSIPTARRKTPAAPRVFRRLTGNSNGPQKTSTACRLFRRLAGEFQRLAGKLRRLPEFSDGAPEIPTSRRKIPTAHRKTPTACRISSSAPGNSGGALEIPTSRRKTSTACRRSRWHVGRFPRLTGISDSPPCSPTALWSIPKCRGQLPWPAAFSDGRSEHSYGAPETPAAHRVLHPFRRHLGEVQPLTRNSGGPPLACTDASIRVPPSPGQGESDGRGGPGG